MSFPCWVVQIAELWARLPSDGVSGRRMNDAIARLEPDRSHRRRRRGFGSAHGELGHAARKWRANPTQDLRALIARAFDDIDTLNQTSTAPERHGA